jgi:hypothetical protein
LVDLMIKLIRLIELNKSMRLNGFNPSNLINNSTNYPELFPNQLNKPNQLFLLSAMSYQPAVEVPKPAARSLW